MKKEALENELRKIKQRLDRIEQAVKSNVNKTWCGFTDEQWDHIRKHNYLVQIKQGDNWLPPSPLSESDFTEMWKRERRLYKAPGIAKPWFGGKCPLDRGTRILFKTANGDIIGGYCAGELDWSCVGDARIVEYVSLEE